MNKKLSFICIIILLHLISCSSTPTKPEKHPIPPVMLWAWEKHVDLSFIDPQKIGVAFLARSLYIKGDAVIVTPRFKPIKVPTDIFLMGVVRITNNHLHKPQFTKKMRNEIIDYILDIARVKYIHGIQIDYDATESERAFYRALIHNLKKQLPAKKMLSMTALASWCMDDAWISNLPVDEIVPMLFRMGPDGPAIIHMLDSGNDFKVSRCQTSIGISIDEPLKKRPTDRRIYVFSPGPWSAEAVKKIVISGKIT